MAEILLGVAAFIIKAGKAAQDVNDVVQTAREFKSNFESIDQELHAIVGLMQTLYKDLNSSSQENIPPAIEARLKELVDSGEKIMEKVERTLKPYRVTGFKKHARVFLGGKEDIQELKQDLLRLKTSLSFVVDMMTLFVSKNIKADTGKILEDTQGLHLVQKQILQEIHGLRSNNNNKDQPAEATEMAIEKATEKLEITDLDQLEGIQILEELKTIQFDRDTFDALICKMQALGKQDPDNFLVNKYLDSLTNYAESTIDPNEYVPERKSIWRDSIDPPSYYSEDPLGPLESFDSMPAADLQNKDTKAAKPLSRSMTTPAYSASKMRPRAQRQKLSEDLKTDWQSTSPPATAESSIAESPTSPRVFSPEPPGSQASSMSQLTTGSVLPDASWVEKQAEARYARDSADSKTLRKLNGQLRCIGATTSAAIVEGLLLKGADPNSSNRKYKANVVDVNGLQSKEASYDTNRCALVNAICARNIECVRLLLAYGADPNFDDGFEQTCLFFAVAYGEEEIVEALVRAKANVNKVEVLDRCPGDWSWPSGSPFLGQPGAQDEVVRQVEINCHSALMTAISMAAVDWHAKRSSIINLLLAYSADATEKAHKHCHNGKERAHMTPLGLAAANIAFGGDGEPEGEWPATQVCRLLLDAGANVNSLTLCKETQSLATPLDRAILREPPVKGLAELLLARGGSVSLSVDGAKAGKQHVRRLAAGINALLIADDDGLGGGSGGGGLEWLVTLLAAHRVLGVTMLLQLVAEFSVGEDTKTSKEHDKPRHYSREALEAAVGRLRRCGITSREEGQVHYVRRKRFYDTSATNWAEGNIDAMTLIREMQLVETKISRFDLIKLMEGPLLD